MFYNPLHTLEFDVKIGFCNVRLLLQQRAQLIEGKMLLPKTHTSRRQKKKGQWT
jgi:hypothetical protein